MNSKTRLAQRKLRCVSRSQMRGETTLVFALYVSRQWKSTQLAKEVTSSCAWGRLHCYNRRLAENRRCKARSYRSKLQLDFCHMLVSVVSPLPRHTRLWLLRCQRPGCASSSNDRHWSRCRDYVSHYNYVPRKEIVRVDKFDAPTPVARLLLAAFFFIFFLRPKKKGEHRFISSGVAIHFDPTTESLGGRSTATARARFYKRPTQ